MMNLRLAGFLVLILLPSAAAQEGLACRISERTQARLLAMDVEAFDRDPEGGWRPYVDVGCSGVAADLLEAYIAAHHDRAAREPELHFHAGQVRAFLGDYETALAHMQHAFFPDPPSEQTILREWNVYVRATIAFLERDRKVLAETWREMAGESGQDVSGPWAPPTTRRDKMRNADIVAGLLACFDAPYRQAYSPQCRQR